MMAVELGEHGYEALGVGRRLVRFTVHGNPVPQGSKRAFANPKNASRPILVESAGPKHKHWRSAVLDAAAERMRFRDIIDGPVNVAVRFYFLRPKSHFRANGQVKPAHADPHHRTRPDLDKLPRAVCDSLSGVVYRDDNCVVSFDGTRKLYAGPGEGARAEIEVTAL